MSKRARHHLRGIGVGVVVALALTACASEVPELTEPADIAGAALSLEQNQRVLDQLNEVLAQATETLDPAGLSERLTGPALDLRIRQLEVAAILGHTNLVTYFPALYLRDILPAEDTWPRTMYAITEMTADLQPPRLLALVQEDARSPYQLWGWVQLRPGVMPRFEDATIGSVMMAADDDSLWISPADAVAQYLDLLTHGSASAFTGNFEPQADDPYRSLLASLVANQQDELEPDDPLIQGSNAWSFTLRPGTQILTVRSADGGALVMAAIDALEVMSAVEGAFINWRNETAIALMGDAEPTNHLTQGFLDMIALYIPAEPGAPISLLGYSHVQTYASNAAPPGAATQTEEEQE
ncbi:MAG: hypothetical protein FWG11_05885 [Promicromonosporaceae bacterium]|nr:hypothetical protein [Promicromonosporaceae bacterium]